MNLFSITQDYRMVGPNYGLPMWFIDFGSGISLEPVKLIERLYKTGLKEDAWVCIRKGLSEKGIGVFTNGLKMCRVKVEIETDNSYKVPGWFIEPDRWLVYWKGQGQFNLGSLRARQDMVVCDLRTNKLEDYLIASKVTNCYKGIVVESRKEVFNIIKDLEVKVYEIPSSTNPSLH